MEYFMIKTRAGIALDQKLPNGNICLTLTKAKSGAGKVTLEELGRLDEIVEEKQELILSPIIRSESNTNILPVKLKNTGLAEGYTLYQIGIYAEDPELGEILYQVAQITREEGEVIPSEVNAPGFSIEWNLSVSAGNAETVEVIINEAGTLTVKQADNRYVSKEKAEEVLSNYYTKDETAANLFGKPLSFTEAKADVDIASGDSLKVILGKLLKTIKTFRTKHTTIENTLQNLSGTTPISRGGTGQTVRYEAVELTRKTTNTPADSTTTCRYYPYLKMCFARLYIAPRNTLIYKTGEAYVLYTIPEAYRPSAIYAGSLHVGGSANGTVRVNSAGEMTLIPDKDIATGWGVYITAFWLL